MGQKIKDFVNDCNEKKILFYFSENNDIYCLLYYTKEGEKTTPITLEKSVCEEPILKNYEYTRVFVLQVDFKVLKKIENKNKGTLVICKVDFEEFEKRKSKNKNKGNILEEIITDIAA